MIQAAVIGTGNISGSHIEGLLHISERCRIAALIDIYPERRRPPGKNIIWKGTGFDSHEKLLESGLKIDLVHICTPPSSHAEIAVHCMDAGCNVLVESPMALQLKGMRRYAGSGKRNGVTVGVVGPEPFQEQHLQAEKTADSGLAGKIRCAHVNSLWWRGALLLRSVVEGNLGKEGGGPTLNHAVHHIDMINWIQGGLPTEVTSVLAK